MRSSETATPEKKGAKGLKYSPTYKLGSMKEGQSIVFMPLSRSEKEDAKRGKVPIFTVKIKGVEGHYSIFWPEGLIEPPILTPVRLTRKPGGDFAFTLDVPENDAERASLWT